MPSRIEEWARLGSDAFPFQTPAGGPFLPQAPQAAPPAAAPPPAVPGLEGVDLSGAQGRLGIFGANLVEMAGRGHSAPPLGK